MAQLSTACTSSVTGISMMKAAYLPEHVPPSFPKLLDNTWFSH